MKKTIILLIIIGAIYGGFLFFKDSDDSKKTSKLTQDSIKIIDIDNLPDLKANEEQKGEQIINVGVSSSSLPSIIPIKSTVNKLTEKKEVLPQKQVVKAVITFEDGLLPSIFTLEAGVPVRFEIDPKDDGEGCMSTLMIPDLYDDPFLVKAGDKIIMEFTPKKPGTYYITCVMGVPWGEIEVVNL
jgi:plastocyanin domain-containing protein